MHTDDSERLDDMSSYQRFTITGDATRATEYWETDDDADTGYPNEYADLTTEYRRGTNGVTDALAAAAAHAGKSRTGASGVRVTVTVNGQKV